MKKIFGVLILIIIAGAGFFFFADSDRRERNTYLKVVQTDVFPALQSASKEVVKVGEAIKVVQFDTALGYIASARDYANEAEEVFDGLTPPEDLTGFHGLLKDAFSAHEKALSAYEVGLTQNDISSIQQGVSHYQDVGRLIKEATAQVKKTE